MGRGRRKEKPLTLDLFHVLPNIKLFAPDHAAPQVLLLPLSQKVMHPPSTGYKGKVPPRALLQPPSPAPLKKGKALSCQYPSCDTQTLWGLRNNSNLTNCPQIPACFLPPAPPQREGGKDKRHLKQEKNPTQLKEGQKTNCHLFLKTQLA